MRDKALKRIGAGLLVVSLLGLCSTAERLLPKRQTAVEPPAGITVPSDVSDTIAEAARSGEPTVEMEFMADSEAGALQLKQSIESAGGQILLQEREYVQAKLPVAAAQSVPQASRVVAMGINQKVEVDRTRVAAWDDNLPSDGLNHLASVSLDAIGVQEFRSEHGVDGSGIKIAVVDSGVDPGHPDLAVTSGGSNKIVDWKDFTGEGQVDVSEQVPWGTRYTASNGRAYRLPARPAGSRGARFAYWEEFGVVGEINRDLDRNGSQTDRFGVLLVDSASPGVYDTVYVDTNNDGDFNDEEPLTVFRNSPAIGRLGGVREGRQGALRLNFVVADLDPAGRSVTFGFDGLGHGTQVAGVLAANGGQSGFTGVAPGVQIMALKAIRATGGGTWFSISSAIKYAAEHGAAIINVSIGGLASVARFDSAAAERLNQIARQYGVLIVLAADNTGPGLSSGTTLGSAAEVMSVGAYYSPEMYKRDFGWVVPSEGIYWRSGMGPRSDGSYLPSVVAPGGSPTTSPRWLNETGYTTTGGTSIATPHVSGAAALLMQAGQLAGVNHDRMSTKWALEMGARRIPGYDTAEQGNGLITLESAFNRLKKINSLPALSARSGEGGGGLLARSYTPGNAEFWLSNLNPGLTRVNIVSSDAWVHPLSKSLTLPPGVPRQLLLQVDPPPDTGIHSAFLTVLEQEKYGPTVTIPVTFIRPHEFRPETDYSYTASDRLEVARYQRYFFKVEPGTDTFSVSTRVLPAADGNAQGTVQVQVFRPDGESIFQSNEIGTHGDGLAALFQTGSPVAGVWEVVVTAMPDSSGDTLQAAFSVEANVKPGPLGGASLQFEQPLGGEHTHTFQVTNTFSPFTGNVEAVGLTRTDYSMPWRVIHQLNLADDFTLPESAGYLRIELDNPVPSGVDLDVQLYQQNASASSGYVLIGQSATPETSHEVIEIPNVPSGRYQVFVTANGTRPEHVQYQYRRLVASGGYQVQAEDPVRKHELGESWTPSLDIRSPSSPGRYKGYLLIRDKAGPQTLAWFPFEVSVGQPALDVEAMASQLTRGRPSYVTLELRDASSRHLVNGTVTVNGRRYVSRFGQVSVLLTPYGSTQEIEVEADVQGYQIVHKHVALDVLDAWGYHPIGVDGSQENSIQWRKLVSEWP